MPRKTWPSLFVLLAVLGTALHFILLEAVGTAALDSLVEHALGWLGLEKSRMSAVIAPYVIPGTIAALCLFAAYKLGEFERLSFEPKADIDSRLAFELILKNKKWLSKHTEFDEEKLRHLVPNYLAIRLDGEIHDALVQGRLWAWGRKNLAKFADGPFDKIPAGQWAEMEIVFLPTAEWARTFTHTRVGKQMAYTDIKLNAKQIAKEFSISVRALR